MNDLHRALGDIGSIRRQMARSAEFRGYGPATLASTGVLALVAGGVQKLLVANPVYDPRIYLAIWLSTAVLAGTLIAVQTVTRARRMHSGMADEMLRMAVEQFLPSAGAGALIVLVIVRFAPQSMWMIPGLWQVILSLGVFSSCRFLPRPMTLAGGWYMLTGLFCLALGDARALSPWAMALPFAVGQMMVAAVLLHAAREDVYGE